MASDLLEVASALAHDRAMAVGSAVERCIVLQNQLAVAGCPYINLDEVRMEGHTALNSSKGALRCMTTGTAMSDAQDHLFPLRRVDHTHPDCFPESSSVRAGDFSTMRMRTNVTAVELVFKSSYRLFRAR